MQTNNPTTKTKIFKAISALIFLSIGNLSIAATIQITGDQLIDKPTNYNNDTLNVTGRFIIKPGGSLHIENSILNIKASTQNSFFVYLTTGTLTLKNNNVNIDALNIAPNKNNQSLFQLIKVDQGTLNIIHNNLSVNQNYSVGLLTTNQNYMTHDFKINQNSIKNFHGGLYLINSNNMQITDNVFSNVSLSNILNTGSSSEYSNNIFNFPGNLALGNAFDIIDSDNIDISNNIIASSSNLGIHVVGGVNLIIDNNKITDCLSYAISIENPSQSIVKRNTYLAKLGSNYTHKYLTNTKYKNSNITITNNHIAQNRYGLTAQNVTTMIVLGNIFIQKFQNPTSRSFWTNNDNLLTSVDNLTWFNNLYKEAFTQEVPGDNDSAKKFVPFPVSGGVAL